MSPVLAEAIDVATDLAWRPIANLPGSVAYHERKRALPLKPLSHEAALEVVHNEAGRARSYPHPASTPGAQSGADRGQGVSPGPSSLIDSEERPRSSRLSDQSKIGGAPMSVRHGAGGTPPAYPRIRQSGVPNSSTNEGRTAEEAIARDWEHARLYDAVEKAAQLAELAGDDDIAEDLRILRRKVARHLRDGACR